MKIIKNSIISIILSLSLLSIFMYFYRYSMGEANNNNTTDAKNYPNQFMSNMEEGFAWLYCDKNGFNNVKTPINGVDILIIGSSHTEALHVSSNENYGYLLNQLLPQYFTYNIGMSGHFLPTNINNLSNAYNFYLPRKCVVIEMDDRNYNIDDFQKVYEGKLPRMIPNDGGVKGIIKHSLPLIKTVGQKIGKQLICWYEKSKNSLINKMDDEMSIFDEEKYTLIFNNFMAFAKKSVKNNIPIILFFHPKSTIDSNGCLIIKNKKYIELLKKACEYNNIIFIDFTQDMVDLYNRNHLLMHGFINSKVGHGHLNKYGHEVIAKRLAKEIKKLEGEKNGSK